MRYSTILILSLFFTSISFAGTQVNTTINVKVFAANTDENSSLIKKKLLYWDDRTKTPLLGGYVWFTGSWGDVNNDPFATYQYTIKENSDMPNTLIPHTNTKNFMFFLNRLESNDNYTQTDCLILVKVNATFANKYGAPQLTGLNVTSENYGGSTVCGGGQSISHVTYSIPSGGIPNPVPPIPGGTINANANVNMTIAY